MAIVGAMQSVGMNAASVITAKLNLNMSAAAENMLRMPISVAAPLPPPTTVLRIAQAAITLIGAASKTAAARFIPAKSACLTALEEALIDASFRHQRESSAR